MYIISEAASAREINIYISGAPVRALHCGILWITFISYMLSTIGYFVLTVHLDFKAILFIRCMCFLQCLLGYFVHTGSVVKDTNNLDN